MAALGVCLNSPRCSKARSGEQVDFYPGFGEVCPECGRPLRKVTSESAPASPGAGAALNEANAGGRAVIVPPAAPPEPVARPRRLITGHSPSEAPPPPDVPIDRAPPPSRPAAAKPIIPPIVPIVPEAQPRHDQAEPPPSAVEPIFHAPEAAAAPVEAPASAPAAEPPAPEAVPAARATEPPPAEPEQAPLREAAIIPPSEPGARWFIPTPAPSDEQDEFEPVSHRPQARRTIPRTYIFTGLGIALLAALGSFIYNLAGPLMGARSTPAAAAFHVCGTRAIAGRLGVNLAKAFFTKLGAGDATVSPYGSTGLVVTARIPGRWQPQSIAIDTSEDSTTISSLSGKTCQIGMLATATDNRAALANAGILGKVIGYDANVVVANPANPVNRLSTSQLAGIFSGAITNWSQVGGQNAPIAVFAPDEPSYYLSAFRHTVLNGSSLPPGARLVNDLAAVSTSVARDRNAIGFVGFVFADPGRVLKLAGDGGDVLPTAATIGQRHYPLTIPVYMYNTAQQTEPMVFDFVDFARSDAGQTVVEDAGYVSRLSL